MNPLEKDEFALSEPQRRQIRMCRAIRRCACVAQRVYSFIESSIGRPLAAAGKIIDSAAGLTNGTR